MDVVGHQAVSEDLDLILEAVFALTLKLHRAVFIVEENVFAPVAALGDLMRNAGEDLAGNSSN